MTTLKQYYVDPFQSRIKASVTKIVDKGLIFDKTVSYAEGGGQIGDSGLILNLRTKKKYEYIDTTKIPGRVITSPHFPTITVENDIIHHMDGIFLDEFKMGDECEIIIDVEKRINVSFNHTAVHIALMAAEKIRPELRKRIYGAKINEKYGRLDFKLISRFSPEEMKEINNYANEIVNDKIDIEIFPLSGEKEALYWKCSDFVIPCGGTHATNTQQLGEIIVRRKNIGKMADRLIANFNLEKLPLNMFVDKE